MNDFAFLVKRFDYVDACTLKFVVWEDSFTHFDRNTMTNCVTRAQGEKNRAAIKMRCSECKLAAK